VAVNQEFAFAYWNTQAGGNLGGTVCYYSCGWIGGLQA